ncbi:unnamed protein product [Rhizophagus irregularis]|nr:unnamed protein product [Rhizophagus irregularis]
MITITQHSALVLPIFNRLSTGAITHIDWYYIVESLNRNKNISANSDIQQLEKTPTINLNGDNLGLWINRWVEQDTLKQELTNIRHQLKSLKNIEYYTDGSLANRTIDNNNFLYRADNTTVDLGAAFYTSNELGEFSVYLCLSLWPSSTRAEIVAIFLALLTAPENSNVTIYTDSLGAINSINLAFNSTTRTWLKKTNNLIIIKIIMLIREASINLKLIKIKGHSGIQSPLDITNPRNIGYTDHNEKELPGLRNGRLRREVRTLKWTLETRRTLKWTLETRRTLKWTLETRRTSKWTLETRRNAS